MALPKKVKTNINISPRQPQPEYDYGYNGVMNLIYRVSDNLNFIAIFGHNPTFENIYCDIAGVDYHKFPTCAMVICSSDIDSWNNFSIKESKLEYYDYPKNIK